MPIKALPTNKGISEDGAYFCSGMSVAPDGGVMPYYKCKLLASQTSGSILENLTQITDFAQRTEEVGDRAVWGAAIDDLFVESEDGDFSIAEEISWASDEVQGLEVSDDNEIVFIGTKYIGKTITTTTSEAVSYTETGVDVTSTTSFPGASDFTFIGADGKVEVAYYGSISGSTLTLSSTSHRGKYNTTATNFSTGDVVVAYRKNFLTFTDTFSNRPSTVWEDYILIGNDNKIAGWKEDDGSDFSENLLDLPSAYSIVDITTAQMSGREMTLIVADKGGKSYIFIWDGKSDSWDRRIKIEDQIDAIEKNYFTIPKGLCYTDGYDYKLLSEYPEAKNSLSPSEGETIDIEIRGNDIMLLRESSQKYYRESAGIWIYNTQREDWSFVPNSQYAMGNDLDYGAISSVYNGIYVSNDYKDGAVDILQSEDPAVGKSHYYQKLFKAPSEGEKKLKKIKLDLRSDTLWEVQKDWDTDIIVRYCDFKKSTLGLTFATGGADASTLNVVPSQETPQVGDKIMILDKADTDRADNAGEIRNITDVSGSYTITLDEPLSEAPAGYTRAVLLQDLKKVGQVSLKDSINNTDLVFNVDDQPEGRNFLIEVEFRRRGDSSTPIIPILENIIVEYDEQSI